jgi:hypothetical protein
MGLSATDKVTIERVERVIESFIPAEEKSTGARGDELRRHAIGLARAVVALAPDNYERAMALAKVEETVMWTFTAIQHGEAR